MATLVASTTSKGAGNYVGETKKQLRDGFGVYNYPNKFFRYEGEWSKGKKHGHGKLLMADGSFYEGQFQNGEIQGHGFRYWASSGNKYTGQFVKGELNGHGILKYGSGGSYEGEWMDNQREGQGKLTEADGSVYEGSFHNHKRHGEGFQTYGNGDHYEGDWVNGIKQGHGVMKFADGSIYGGQWWGDVFNGEGSLIHASGMSYEGIWVSGHPEVEAVQLHIIGDEYIEVGQGRPFGFEVECRTSDGEPVPDEGRVLQVTAGVKAGTYRTIDPDEERTLTPFGFEIEPYPVTEMLAELTGETISVPGTTPALAPSRAAQSASPPGDPGANDVTVQLDAVRIVEPSEAGDKERDSSVYEGDTGLRTAMASQGSATIANTSSDRGQAEEPVGPSATNIPAPVSPVRTVDGKGLFENIYLPPLPPGVKSWTSLTSVPSGGDVSMDKRGSIFKWKKAGSSLNPSHLKASLSGTPEGSKRKKEGMADVVEKVETKKKKDKKDLEKVEDRLCRQGDYVVIIEDVTSPPFLGAHLQPAFLHVKVTPKTKRAKSRMERKH